MDESVWMENTSCGLQMSANVPRYSRIFTGNVTSEPIRPKGPRTGMGSGHPVSGSGRAGPAGCKLRGRPARTQGSGRRSVRKLDIVQVSHLQCVPTSQMAGGREQPFRSVSCYRAVIFTEMGADPPGRSSGDAAVDRPGEGRECTLPNPESLPACRTEPHFCTRGFEPGPA